jgi:hypothetical protein
VAVEIPEAVLARKPELRPVVAALAQHAAGEPVTAPCHGCGLALLVEPVVATGAIVVRCANGDTFYRQVGRAPLVATVGDPLVTAADAAARGLPAIDVFADVRAARMSVTPFPAAGMYVSASGPPGAPSGFAVWASSDRETDDVGQAVLATVTDRSLTPVVIGDSARLAIDGVSRPAALFTTGSGYSRTGWVGALVGHPAGTVLVALGRVGAMPDSVLDVLRDESLAVVARTVRIA